MARALGRGRLRGRTVAFVAACGLLLAALGTAALGADHPTAHHALKTIVINAAPLSGSAVPINEIPGNVQVLTAASLSAQGTASLTGALNTQLSSININDNVADPFQPDILYRGFEASPVLGTPQGLAVYENGVRINEAFGDTVNWDLILPSAIDQVELSSSSAVYGLNALGGAISLTMKNGFNYRGGEVQLSGGSFHRHEISAQYGMHSGMFGFYVAGRGLNWRGWREFSSDQLRDLFAVVSLHGRAGSLDLSYAWDDNTLKGQSSAPVQELAINRSLVFTGPQANLNRLKFLILNGRLKLPGRWTLAAVLYYRDFSQAVANGNGTSYIACRTLPGVLCQPDGVTPLTNAAGQALPDISAGGTRYIGENDLELLHSWGRGATLQTANDAAIFGHTNHFTVGAAVDYASSGYYAGAQLGLLNAQLVVQPSALFVDTPENSPGALANGDAVPVNVDSVNKAFGVYLTDTFNVTAVLAVTAGGRYNIAQVNLADQLGTRLSGHNRYVHFNPSIGATYALGHSTTLYGDYSVNNRVPTPGEIECSDPQAPCLLPASLSGDPPTLRQVVSHTMEIGLRGTVERIPVFGGAMRWNFSVFRTVLHDDIHGVATSLSSGYFANIGDTRRQGLETGVNFDAPRWSAYLHYSLVRATFLTALVIPASSNPFQDASGNIHVQPGDQFPGIPENRWKIGGDLSLSPIWSIGMSVNIVSSVYYVGDESNQLAPLRGYTVVEVHSSYRPRHHVRLFLTIENLLDSHYATWGILSDPTGVGAPGIPVHALTNGPGVNNRFISPAAPLEVFGGVRVRF